MQWYSDRMGGRGGRDEEMWRRCMFAEIFPLWCAVLCLRRLSKVFSDVLKESLIPVSVHFPLSLSFTLCHTHSLSLFHSVGRYKRFSSSQQYPYTIPLAGGFPFVLRLRRITLSGLSIMYVCVIVCVCACECVSVCCDCCWLSALTM